MKTRTIAITSCFCVKTHINYILYVHIIILLYNIEPSHLINFNFYTTHSLIGIQVQHTLKHKFFYVVVIISIHPPILRRYKMLLVYYIIVVTLKYIATPINPFV